jgi:hypothetical protein
LIVLCFTLWPLAGYTATAFAAQPYHDVNEAAQDGLEVSISASASEAAVGDMITYTYRITNSGAATLPTINAVDDRLGAVAGLAGALPAAASRSDVLIYVVQPSDAPDHLVNTVTVTATDGVEILATASASVTVDLVDPTGMPRIEQPEQPRGVLYLPSLRH